MTGLTNWAGNHTFAAANVHQATSVAHVQDIVSRAGVGKVHTLGSRHSFNAIADGDELIELALPTELTVDRAGGTISFAAGLKYGDLAEALAPEGVALHNMASLPHISVAGAVATGTHGSGDANGNLATAVAALEIVTSTGELLRAARGEPDFDGLVVALGAAGVVTRLTLDVQPAYTVRQTVYEHLPWPTLFANFDAITSSGYSVSLFTRWGPTVEQVWVKARATEADQQAPMPADLFGAAAATVDRHPIFELDASSCTPQRGQLGPWSTRLPHFRMDATPSSGDELQSEYFVPRQHAVDAINVVRAMAARLTPLLKVSEIRTVAADRLWLSPEYGRDSVGLHFTWQVDQPAVEALLVELEAALAPFGARPHWGKLFAARANEIAALYERLPDFLALLERVDPRGAFRNDWFAARVAG